MTERSSNIAVAGAGRMGRGIALSCAWAGYHVSLVDSEERTTDEFVETTATTAMELLRESHALADTGIISRAAADNITARIDIVSRAAGTAALRMADFVFEAVAEVPDIKQSTYAWLSEAVSDSTILASTTSTMLSDTLAGFVTHPERFTNAHWLNPAYLMPLVEISPAAQTSAEVVAALRELIESIGKVPVECRASPGYIVPRIQALVMNEAARLVEEGVASAEDVDRAIRTGFGPRYTVFGALEFVDWGGGDILYYASRYLSETINEVRFSSPDVVEKNMAAGRNGMREGQGFYNWRNIDVDAFRVERLATFTNLLGHLKLLPQPSGDKHG